MNLPRVRTTELVVMELDRELLVYDLKTHRAYQLNETSQIVFNACDGINTFEDLAKKHGYTEDLIYLTLDTLAKKNLIAEPYQSKLAGVSRREAIRKVGLASMIALPLISSLVAPKAADAASINLCQVNSCKDGGLGNGGGCNPPNGCGALGSVCCSDGNFCVCFPAAVCASSSGQVCP